VTHPTTPRPRPLSPAAALRRTALAAVSLAVAGAVFQGGADRLRGRSGALAFTARVLNWAGVLAGYAALPMLGLGALAAWALWRQGRARSGNGTG
jgi:hypothetical protein